MSRWSLNTCTFNLSALKYGFIDDVEFALDDSESVVQVRSASREGYLDFGVNGKRLNWISAKLRAKGADRARYHKRQRILPTLQESIELVS